MAELNELIPNKDEVDRLERLSDNARKGIPINFFEAIEVIKYQEMLMRKRREKSFLHRIVKWMKSL